MAEGIIVKAISGFYYVDCAGQVLECKARGVFKKKGINPLVGDSCTVEQTPEGGKVVSAIKERINSFERPPLANAQLMVITCSAKDPEPSFVILDRLIITAQAAGAKVLVCVNKADLLTPQLKQDFEERYKAIYPLVFVSAKTGQGVAELKKALCGMQAAFSGQSGVGKSSLINLLLDRDATQVGEISQKNLRGKNTTRHTELFKGDGFYIFDTPGFTAFDAALQTADQLDRHFPEMEPYIGKCRFDNCKHISEPDCAVKQALAQGKINQGRYDSYTELLKQIEAENRY